MTRDEVMVLPLGLYRVWWETGGSSLASIGQGPDGTRWIAPTNWVAPALTLDWDEVLHLEPINVPTPSAETLETAHQVREARVAEALAKSKERVRLQTVDEWTDQLTGGVDSDHIEASGGPEAYARAIVGGDCCCTTEVMGPDTYVHTCLRCEAESLLLAIAGEQDCEVEFKKRLHPPQG